MPKIDWFSLFLVVAALCFICRQDQYLPAIWLLMALTMLGVAGWRFLRRKGTSESRRWFRFDLSILFLRITAIAVLLGSIAWRLDNLRKVDALLDPLFERKAVSGIGYSHGYFGAELKMLALEDGKFSDDEVRQLESLCPGLKIKHGPR